MGEEVKETGLRRGWGSGVTYFLDTMKNEQWGQRSFHHQIDRYGFVLSADSSHSLLLLREVAQWQQFCSLVLSLLRTKSYQHVSTQ